MTDQAQSTRQYDLVGLYAGRLRSQYRRPASVPPRTTSSEGVHTFGRRPARRNQRRKLSGRKRTVAALVTGAVVASTASAAASPVKYQVQPGDTLTQIAREHLTTVEALVQYNGIENPDVIYAGNEILLEEGVQVNVGDTIYQVKDGDTLYEIAEAHGVTMASIIKANDLDDEDVIYTGDSLVIPTGSPGTAEVNGQDSHQIGDRPEQAPLPEPGQENNQQADQGTDQQADEGTDQQGEQNAGTNETQSPLNPWEEDDIVSLHLVAQGETLSSIAARYGVSVDSLAAINEIEDVSNVAAGSMLKIPSATYGTDTSVSSETSSAEDSSVMLNGVPALQQSLALSCESAALSMATAYWGYQVSEWVFIENMPYSPNPHKGFRGDMNAQFGGTDNYGVYPGPLASMLSNYGFVGDEFYTGGDIEPLKNRLDMGQPVLVWMTSNAAPSERIQETHEGENFTLVPQQHVVVAYGYDDQGIHVADPGTGQYRTFAWDDFVESWSLFDGMSMAVYPNG